MDLIDKVKQLSQRVSKMKDNITTEEATKMSLIIPFFQMLGYDVFNPEEFLPEFTADIGIKKGEKVDYAIIVNGKPTILIECKWCGESLERHDSQLFRYFGTTSAKFAILTNGIVYKFFTDLDETNKMDLIPFLELDLENLRENTVAEVKRFHKDSFDPDNLVSAASELRYTKALKDFFEEQLKNPSDDFIRFFVGQVYTGTKTQAIIEKFSIIVKKALNDFVSEKMNEKIKTALSSSDQQEQPIAKEEDVDNIPAPKIITTQEELEAYYIIKSILNGTIDLSRLYYKDTESYFNILIDNKVTRWVCRLRLDGKKKYIFFPTKDKSMQKMSIADLNDLYSLKDLIISAAKQNM